MNNINNKIESLDNTNDKIEKTNNVNINIHDDLLLDNNSLVYTRLILNRLVGFRPLAYTSEVGEAVRPVTKKIIVSLAYILSFGYVFADIGLKLYDIKNEEKKIIYWKGIDLTLWHMSASIITPAIAIHTIVNSVNKVQNKFIQYGVKLPIKFKTFFPSVVGLASIFFIIKPIDDGTDYMLNNFVRPYYPVKIPENHH